MADVVIETEQPCDVASVDYVVRRAFRDHVEVGDMVAAVRRSPRYEPSLTFVARSAETVVGFVMLSRVDVVDDDSTRHEVLSLTPLAVAPDQQRQGIGSALVCTAVAAADARGDQVVVLEGSPRFYGRLGFTYAPDHGITLDLPDWAPREAAQVYLLTSWDATIRGRVEYPPAIADVTR